MQKIFIGALLSLLVVGIAWVAVKQPEPAEQQEKIVIGYLPITAALPLFVAKEQGYFLEQGLEVELVEFKTSNDVMAAAQSGHIDLIGTSATNASLDAMSSVGVDVEMFIANNYVKRPDGKSTDFVLVRKDLEIDNMSDLKGKNVAFFPGSVGRVFAKALFPKYGLSVNEVSYIELPPDQWLPALQSGSIDAVVGAVEPFAALILDAGAAEILVDGYYAELVSPAPASGAFFIKGRLSEEQEGSVVTAYRSAVTHIDENETEAIKTLLTYTSVPESVLANVNLQEWTFTDDPNTAQAAKAFAATLFKHGGIQGDPSTIDWLWP